MIIRFLELIRFSHTVFALPFALLAAIMAWGENTIDAVPFRWKTLLGILLCMVTARSFAMAFNRIADRHFDALNPRTQQRHIPTGKLSVKAVAFFTLLSASGFVLSTLLFLPENSIPLYASVPVLVFLLGYSYAKRFTVLSHFWLGAALMLAPVAAWVAIRASLSPAPIILGVAVLFWVAGFDVIYACQDFAFDVKARLHSIPARFGIANALKFAAFCHFCTVLTLFLLPLVYKTFGTIYFSGVVLIAVLLGYEHWIVRPDDLSRVNRAFFHVNAIISIGLLIVGALDILF